MSASGADTSDSIVIGTSDAWSTDAFHFTSNVSSEVVFGIRRVDTAGQYLTQHIMGLGANSTLLAALKEVGLIASRCWSMYWGNSGAPTTQSDGVFIFGGYDDSKTTGTNYTFNLNYDIHCDSGMILTLSDVSVVFPSSTITSLFNSASDSRRACILPDYPVLMTLPGNPDSMNNEDYYQNLLNAVGIPEANNTHSTGLNFWGQTYPSDYKSVNVNA
jgi:hypothetical protein